MDAAVAIVMVVMLNDRYLCSIGQQVSPGAVLVTERIVVAVAAVQWGIGAAVFWTTWIALESKQGGGGGGDDGRGSSCGNGGSKGKLWWWWWWWWWWFAMTTGKALVSWKGYCFLGCSARMCLANKSRKRDIQAG